MLFCQGDGWLWRNRFVGKNFDSEMLAKNEQCQLKLKKQQKYKGFKEGKMSNSKYKGKVKERNSKENR